MTTAAQGLAALQLALDDLDQLVEGALEGEDRLQRRVVRAQLREEEEHLVAHDLALVFEQLDDGGDRRRLLEHRLLRARGGDRGSRISSCVAWYRTYMSEFSAAPRITPIFSGCESSTPQLCVAAILRRIRLLLRHVAVEQVDEGLERVAVRVGVLAAQQVQQHADAALEDEPHRLPHS